MMVRSAMRDKLAPCPPPHSRCPPTLSPSATSFRSRTSTSFRRRRSRSYPSAGRGAFTSFRYRRRNKSWSSPRPIPTDSTASARSASPRDGTFGSRSPTPRDRAADRRGVSRRSARCATTSRASKCSISRATTNPRRRRTRTTARASITALVDELLAGGHRRARERHPHRAGRAGHRRSPSRRRRAALARTLPRAVGPALVSRIKILSGLDIADRLRPQDGRARVAINGVAVDLRVSTLPASHGEKVVIRVLDGRSTVLTLEGMGFHADELERIERLLQPREGLDPRHRPDRLRQDDDALRRAAPAQGARREHRDGRRSDRVPAAGHRAGAGEREGRAHVRDGAALDHAAGSRRRADRRDPRPRDGGDRDPGVAHRPPRALDAAHERRAERRHAAHRHRRGELQDRDGGEGRARAAARAPAVRGLSRANATGRATRAAARGFHGRLALVEVLIGSPEFERRVAAGESTERIAEAARADGMRSLWQSGLAHVAAGRTTIDEVLRVATPDDDGARSPSRRRTSRSCRARSRRASTATRSTFATISMRSSRAPIAAP